MVMEKWFPDESDREFAPSQSVHRVFEPLASQIRTCDIEVSANGDAEFNFENAWKWIQVLASWLTMADNSFNGKETKMVELMLSLTVINFILGIPGIRYVIANSSLASLFEKRKRECIIPMPELILLWGLV